MFLIGKERVLLLFFNLTSLDPQVLWFKASIAIWIPWSSLPLLKYRENGDSKRGILALFEEVVVVGQVPVVLVYEKCQALAKQLNGQKRHVFWATQEIKCSNIYWMPEAKGIAWDDILILSLWISGRAKVRARSEAGNLLSNPSPNVLSWTTSFIESIPSFTQLCTILKWSLSLYRVGTSQVKGKPRSPDTVAA